MKRLIPLLLLTFGFASAQAAPSGVLTIRFLDVGQGDAVLITAPEGQSLMYDGGRSESWMRDLIRQYDIKNVALVAASHADSDHITGLVPVVALNKPKFFLNNGLAGTTQIWQKLTNVVSQAGTQGLLAKDQTINLGSVKITVLPPPAGMPEGNQNLHSLGLLVQYGTFKALMTGDSETQETAAWLRKYSPSTLGPIQVYKAIHHGAANGDNANWLRAVRPQNVVIGVGPNNYGHPTQTALSLYAKAGARVYRTDTDGTVTVTVRPDGTFQVDNEKGPARYAVPAVTPVPSGQLKAASPVVPPPARDVDPSSVYYLNCAAVRAAGKAPLLRGQPGYSSKLDRDGDGRACE